ncbi:MAG: outer membrane protein Imp, required for envelope biosis, partial [Myxococcaceae bacterium]|nr:outer membrane protein Imp, required for envelope biosis [Myxococcaceae bacterium]
MHLALLILAAVGAEPAVFELSAEQIVHDGATRRAYAEGNAELVTTGAALHADRITWDRDSSSATAIGHVALRLTSGELLVVIADVLTVRFEDDEVREVFVNDGKVLSKKGITPEALRAITTPEGLSAAGETTMLLIGNHLVREGAVWRLEKLELVPCECNFNQPSWSIRSNDATIDTADQRASLWAPTVRVHGVPVLWLPWISLPLSNRQTGLLAPRPGFSGLNGLSLEQPVFITLGRSFDLTLTPGYFGGIDKPEGVSGPRLLTELRYAPAIGTSGKLSLGLLWDLKGRRSPVVPSAPRPGTRGLRSEGSWQHNQELGSGWSTRVDAAFFSDAYYQEDLVSDVLAKEAGYLRSTATLFHRGPGHWAGIDVGFRQDLAYGYPLFGRSGAIEGEPKFGPNPLHRLPAVTWAIPERKLLGPITFGLLADFVRLAPTRGRSGDEGTTANEGRADGASVECLQQRLFWFGEITAPGCAAQVEATQGDGVWQPGEREARDRFQVMPRLSASVPLIVATLTPYAAWRQGIWVGEQTGTITDRGYPVLGARLDSELARSFGGVRHAIAPALELRGIPFVTGTAPAPYDEVDTAIPGTTPQLQGVAELRQRLTRNGSDFARLDLGQGIQLSGPAPTLGESYGSVRAAFGWFSGTLGARVDPVQARLTRLSATASIEDGQGRGGYASYENLINDGTDRSRRPIDLLFALPAATLFPGRAQSVTFGAHWRFGGFGLRYDALMLDRAFQVDNRTKSVLSVAQHSLG